MNINVHLSIIDITVFFELDILPIYVCIKFIHKWLLTFCFVFQSLNCEMIAYLFFFTEDSKLYYNYFCKINSLNANKYIIYLLNKINLLNYLCTCAKLFGTHPFLKDG